MMLSAVAHCPCTVPTVAVTMIEIGVVACAGVARAGAANAGCAAKASSAAPATSRGSSAGSRRTNSVWRHFFAVLNLPPARPKAQSADPVFSLWREVSWTLGRAVTVHHADGSTLRGVAVDIDSDRMGLGALIVEDETGARHAVHAGDVSLRADAARAGA